MPSACPPRLLLLPGLCLAVVAGLQGLSRQHPLALRSAASPWCGSIERAARCSAVQCGELELELDLGLSPAAARSPPSCLQAPRRVTRSWDTAALTSPPRTPASRTGARCAGLQASELRATACHPLACDQSRATPPLTAAQIRCKSSR
ncbi:hypothetical protein K491DRAFT_686858 [Lophiostoma macrostomum CBS 122681]|uniref:Uncharacterized protein n=1 Tax=Lophiostoma macrostomum CBS 122681 TaxID=1314788 RepID=A0A6A6TRC4_9PLEO|nr:hypothetical protein K491DRAFT_686858 [Lophiostoma macrostomum CBS 122681]